MSVAYKFAARIMFVISVLLTLFVLASAIFAVKALNDQQVEGISFWMSAGVFFEMLVRQIGWAALVFGCGAVINLMNERPETSK
jgi:hypothetical protein